MVYRNKYWGPGCHNAPSVVEKKVICEGLLFCIFPLLTITKQEKRLIKEKPHADIHRPFPAEE